MKWCVSAFCFEVRQCNLDMKTAENSANAFSTDKLLLNIRSKMFETLF